MSRLKYWQAGLLAFVVSAILFPALPVPEGLSIPQQVLALLALQLAAVSTACIVVLLRTRSGSLQSICDRWNGEPVHREPGLLPFLGVPVISGSFIPARRGPQGSDARLTLPSTSGAAGEFKRPD